MNRSPVRHRNVRLVDFSLLRRRQFDLRALGGRFNALQCNCILAQVETVNLFEFVDDVIDDALVEIFTAQEGVAIGRQHFKLHLAIDIGDFDNGNVEGTAAQIIYRNLAVALAVFVQSERQCGSSRFVDDALYIETRDTTGVLGRLALRVIEISRHRDDGFGHFFAEVIFGGLFHLAQHFRGNLRRCKPLVAHRDPCIAIVGFGNLIRHQADIFLDFFFFKLAANQALDCVQGVFGIGDGLTFRRRADQNLAILLVRDNGRRGACAF